MSRVVSRMKDLGQKAMALKEALDRAPETVEGIRQTFAATADQLHQLRSEVRGSASELKEEAGLDLQDARRQLEAAADVLRKAGFEVTGVDLELGPLQRLRVHVRRPAGTAPRVTGPAEPPLLMALRTALEQAEAWLLEPVLEALAQEEIILTLGPVPSVRVCWRTPQAAGAAAPEVAPEAQPPAASQLQTTFFPRRASPPPAPGPRKWTQEALERFKQMPSTTKYGRH